MRILAFVFLVVVFLTAVADDTLLIDSLKWDANPVSWVFNPSESSICSRGISDLATYRSKRATTAMVSATIIPTSTSTNGWQTLGVALVDDVDNHWALSFVRSPNGRRYFELCEMRGGEWLSHTRDRLSVVAPSVNNGKWEVGKLYAFKLMLDQHGIRGEIRDHSGALIYSMGFAFGDKPAVKVGRPGLRSMGGFQGKVVALSALSSGEIPDDAPCCAISLPYDSLSFVPGVNSKAEGFFRVRKLDDGRWWVIDPLGRGMFLTGVDHVRYGGHTSIRTKPPTRNYKQWNDAHYPSIKAWCDETLGRLRKWGFNMLGGGATAELHHRGMIYSLSLSMGNSLCVEGMAPEYFICPNERRPCSSFPNVFHPDFAEWCDYVASQKCAKNRNDPWLFGYFIDNELAWWGRGARATGLFDAAMKLDACHTARIAAEDLVRSHGYDPNGAIPDFVKHDYLRLVAERYFKYTSEAIRKNDPNHLVLGARFAGLNGADPVVWEVAGKYCDVVTFNCYPWCDLDRNVTFTERGRNAEPIANAFSRYYGFSQKPILITEWSFPALDSGLPCLHGAGQRFMTQDGRTAATELFAKTMLALPFVIGYDYFMWVDQPPQGISDAFPEDSNYGLVNEKGVPYPGITSMFERLHAEIPKWRNAGLPKGREVLESSASKRSAEFIGETDGWMMDGFCRVDNAWTWTNSVGMVLYGRKGRGHAISNVTLNGRELGKACSMARIDSGKGSVWIDAIETVDFAFKDGCLMLKTIGKRGDICFEMQLKVMLSKNHSQFFFEVVSCTNVGKASFRLMSIFLRQYSPFGGEILSRNVPNLWKAPSRDAWISNDGRWFGAWSLSPDEQMFRYYLGNRAKDAHPDAVFASADLPCDLKAGERHDCGGGAYMMCVGGFGGDKEFKEITR